MSVKSVHSRSYSNNEYIIKLEKHLKDYRRGRGYLSSDTASIVGGKQIETGLNLSDPKYTRLYNGYISAFTYDKKARFVNGVNGAINALKLINAKQSEAESN